MVSWYALTVTTAILYLVPVKYLITTLIDFYRKRPIKLHKKTAIVVLDTIGLNFEKAKELAKKGAKLVIVSNDSKKAELAKEELRKMTKNKNITVFNVDRQDKLSLLEFAKLISETQTSVDFLINNDGFDMSDLDIDFRTQQLAVERFRNHCLNFLLEDGSKNQVYANRYSLNKMDFLCDVQCELSK